MHLYHAPNSAASQKVRFALHEKQLAFEEALIDLLSGEQFSEEYRAKNPGAVVPTLVDGDAVLIESSLINEYLDEAYTPGSLSPAAPADRHAMRLLIQRFDGLHQACGDLSYGVLSGPILQLVGADKINAQIEKMPGTRNRAHRHAVINQGVASDEFNSALAQHQSIFGEMNARLDGRRWLVGDGFSQADLSLAIYVTRVDHLSMGREIDTRAHLKRWFGEIQRRRAYALTYNEVTKPLEDVMRATGEQLLDQIYG